MTPRISDPTERAQVLFYIRRRAAEWHLEEARAMTGGIAALIARGRAGSLEQIAHDIEAAEWQAELEAELASKEAE